MRLVLEQRTWLAVHKKSTRGKQMNQEKGGKLQISWGKPEQHPAGVRSGVKCFLMCDTWGGQISLTKEVCCHPLSLWQ